MQPQPSQEGVPFTITAASTATGFSRIVRSLTVLLLLVFVPCLSGSSSLSLLADDSQANCSLLPDPLTMATYLGPRVEIPMPSVVEVGSSPEPIIPAPRFEIKGLDMKPTHGKANWMRIINESARFLVAQHTWRIALQDKTRQQLRGPYFRDYVNSVRGFSGWDDGDPFITNYVLHPIMGSISGYIYAQNHSSEMYLEFSSDKAYWKSRLKAMAFMTAYSTHYELSPIGEAGIGNVGLNPGTKGWVDIVITPTVGFLWMLGEDALDAKVIRPLEARLKYPNSRRVARSLLNPTRSFANILRGKYPWHRDSRGKVE